MSFWLDDSWDQVGKWSTLIAQWKMSPGHPHAAVRLSNEGDYKLYFKGDKLWKHTGKLDTKHGGRFLGVAKRNSWNDIKIFFKKSRYSDGFAKVWLNGELAFEHEGKTLLKSGRGYTKFGMYTNIMGKRTIYFDEVSFCHSADRERCLRGQTVEQWIANGGPSPSPSSFTTTTTTATTTTATTTSRGAVVTAAPSTTFAPAAPCYTKHAAKYIGGYAAGDSVRRDKAGSSARCDQLGAACSGFTCNKAQTRCTVRGSQTLSKSHTHETSFKKEVCPATAPTTTSTVKPTAEATTTTATTTTEELSTTATPTVVPCPDSSKLRENMRELSSELKAIAKEMAYEALQSPT
eukprot:gnl/TRDRNA2_/TRDRNA2_176735_c1_seq2.p1 gnl/TRDRNA2_/TRDRNA2_176735_c1~~gnl/TRDRNA2_/TRDRNA2_176735_c1_seq2.p1  ORF type:complete len:348 (+),score=25.60 gnl/TRDRNA2_/TRDRNA2_176735_c1_seq2:480-1523(+)